MTLRNLLTVDSVLSLVFGLAFVLVPVPLGSVYGLALNAGGVFIGQLFGAALVGYAVLDWLGRDVTDSKGRQAIALGNLAGNIIAFVFTLLFQLGGGMNQLGWSNVAIFLLLALAYAYFQFVKPSA
jgi:hypothetical protein